MSQPATAHDIFLPKIKQKIVSENAVNEINRITKNIELTDKKELDAQLKKASLLFESNRYWWINDDEMIFDSRTGLVWQGQPDTTQKWRLTEPTKQISSIDACIENEAKLGGLTNWLWPTESEIKEIVTSNFPLLQGENFQILKNRYWQINYGQIDLSNSSFKVDGKGSGYVIARFQLIENKGTLDVLELLKIFTKQKWTYQPHDLDKSKIDDFYRQVEIIIDLSNKQYNYKPIINIIDAWKNIDYFSARLPVIDTPIFSDTNKGLWEFYAPKSQCNQFNKVQSDTFVRGRNPALDIQHAPVAIDFGTSSTVVAIRQNGRDELLRIGVQEKDLNKTITAEQFENPTILEFLNLTKFQSSWQSEAYRPLVNWDHVHCSHEAKASLNNNKEADSKVIASIFPRLKQWALRDEQQTRVVITDQQGTEYTVKSLTEFNPVKGQAIQVSKNYPELDPIEIYAWFLGMSINWRGRGIFLDYYMTFPVAYPTEIKNKIIASFRRGLMRSLPESLLADECINEFNVREWASEPAAYAAAALEKLNIEPTEQGVAYAVFDFGGGTTDFDFGIYREPNEQEEDLYAHVIEHFGASGDPDLGGENLLENLAYLVFKNNQDICRTQQISFTKPLDAEKFVGYERLIDDTQSAYTNTILLMAELRPFWEKGQFVDDCSGTLDIKLLNRQGEAVNCQFTVKQDELLPYLKYRIHKGFVNFFEELKQAFSQQHQALPKVVNILLAGNSSRSKLVKELLANIEKKDDVQKDSSQNKTVTLNLNSIFGQDIPDFKIYYPLDADLKHHDVITAKTGVALGLLRLCPGEGLKVINHAKANHQENSPFQFYVGRQRRGVFEAIIKRGNAYHQWQQIGAVSEDGVFLLLYSALAQALSSEGMKRGTAGLFDHRISFAGNSTGQKVFARIIAPNQIELCSASHLDEVHATGGNNLQQIELS